MKAVWAKERVVAEAGDLKAGRNKSLICDTDRRSDPE
jgi:hypothetical protein